MSRRSKTKPEVRRFAGKKRPLFSAVMLDRLYAFYADFDQIGADLDKLHATYDKALHRLKQGERNHSIVNTGEKLKRLGVRMNKQRKSPKRLELDDTDISEES